jgi:deoxyribodipyrimidine photo-lyase
VDVTEAARAARQAIWAVRKGTDFRAEAARVVEKHASRKDGSGQFVNDRETRTRKAKGDPRQMGFEF